MQTSNVENANTKTPKQECVVPGTYIHYIRLPHMHAVGRLSITTGQVAKTNWKQTTVHCSVRRRMLYSAVMISLFPMSIDLDLIFKKNCDLDRF